MNARITVDVIKDRMLVVRGEPALLDRDVAALYGVEVKAINQAVKNNLDKFPSGYVIHLESDAVEGLRSKIFTLNNSHGRGCHSKYGYKVFTERGLYMLATILKGERAVETTIKIIDTYVAGKTLQMTDWVGFDRISKPTFGNKVRWRK